METTHSNQKEQMKEQVEGMQEDALRTGQKYADRGKNTAADIATDLPMPCNQQQENWTAKTEILQQTMLRSHRISEGSLTHFVKRA